MVSAIESEAKNHTVASKLYSGQNTDIAERDLCCDASYPDTEDDRYLQ